MHHNLLHLLQLLADGRFHSGSKLGKELSMSRSAVWKLIQSLKKYDLDINSVRGKGYRLSATIDFLIQDKIITEIEPEILKHINYLEIFQEITSTNQFLIEKSGEESVNGIAILGEYQSMGRGRRGSKWYSPFGAGINLSLGWHFDQFFESLMQLSLAASIAVVRTLNSFGASGVGVKWPNDIYYKNQKLGGILIEMRGESAGPCDVVIGIGININFPDNYDQNIGQPCIDLASIISPPPSRNKIAARLISELIKILEKYNQYTSQDLLHEWRQHDCINGNVATLILPNESVTGQVLGIDDHGSLIMSVNNKIKKFNAGEISMRLEQ